MRKEGKSGKSERRKRNRKLMANLVSNYKNFKGESAPAKMAILDGTSTLKEYKASVDNIIWLS